MHMGKDTFPGVESGEWVVDEKARLDGEKIDGGVVSVVGKARFESVKTGKAWDEPSFIYSVDSTMMARSNTGRFGQIL